MFSLVIGRALISACPPSVARNMILCIIVRWLTRRTRGTAKPEENSMLFVELNVAGFRFSREVPDLRRKSLRPSGVCPRAMHWRISLVRHSPAA